MITCLKVNAKPKGPHMGQDSSTGRTGYERKSNNHVIGEYTYDWSFGAGKWASEMEI